MMLKKIFFLSASMILAGAMLLAGCTTTTTTTTSATTAGTTTGISTTAATTLAPLTGSIVSLGSSALQPLAQRAADLFMAIHTSTTIQVQGGGSGTGLKQVAEGNCDIGNSDVYAEEKLDAAVAATLADHKVCVVGFAAVVNPKVNVTSLTGQQLIDIFTGKITNWKDVGGSDMGIVIINRPESSGTRATFKKYALNGAEEATGMALTEDSSGTVRQTVKDTDGAVSYLAFSYLDGSVKALQYEGVDPTAANVASGTYPIWSYEHMYTKGEAAGLAKAFIEYMQSSDFAPQVQELGYIPISDMKVTR